MATSHSLGADRLVSAQDLATYLGVPVATVYSWRYRQEGPPAIRIGRHLRYRWPEVQAWLDDLATRSLPTDPHRDP
ncbi:MAG: helix-turn-helix transcriptional regulator [Acidimicrobiia bacterium]|nr:helix-turn-helix domain-containing protein [Acidimicrobiia bacterium]